MTTQTQPQVLPRIPAVELSESETGVHLTLDMPGVPQQAVHVTVNDDVLTIAGVPEPGPTTVRWLRRELRVGEFRREFKLGEGLDPSGIQARLHDGVLDVEIPRAPKALPRKISIEAR